MDSGNWRLWLHGLMGALIGGSVMGVFTATADPHTLREGLMTGDYSTLGKIMLAGGVWSALMYLKQSPIPILIERTTQTETHTVERTVEPAPSTVGPPVAASSKERKFE